MVISMIPNANHRAMQEFLVKLGSSLKFISHKEFRTSLGFIDVVWESPFGTITFEIENCNGDAKVFKNVEKCLFIRPIKHIHIFFNKPSVSVLKFLKEKNCNVIILSDLSGSKTHIKHDKHNLRKNTRLIRESTNPDLIPDGIPTAKFSILNLIKKEKKLTFNQLLEKCGFSRQTVSNSLKKLREEGKIKSFRVGKFIVNVPSEETLT